MPEQLSRTPSFDERLGLIRGEFIESKMDAIFGEEDMGDPAATLRPSEVTAILVSYEEYLREKGFIKE